MALEPALLRAYVLIIASALVPICLGSFASVKPPKDPKVKQTKEEDDFDETDLEHLSSSDAMWIPVIAGVTLVSLFLAFRYLDKDLINLILSSYFHFIGFFMFTRMGLQLTKLRKGRSGWAAVTRLEVLFKKNGTKSASLSFTPYHIFFTLLSLVVLAADLYTEHYLLANLSGTVFCFNALTLVRLDSFKTGAVLLAGLFFYDIYFVFGTTVMVTVATSFEAPIKMVWPKENTSAPSFAMLGLGDIVLPGLFIALALRYDHARHLKRNETVQVQERHHPDATEAIEDATPHEASTASTSPLPQSSAYPKPYFFSVLSAYIVGLVLTITVMHCFKAAQPALLYLSPLCILSVVACASARGESKALWRYKEGDSDDEKTAEAREQNHESHSDMGPAASHLKKED